MCFGASAFGDFRLQFAVAPPAENDQRHVEQQGVDECDIGADPVTGKGGNDCGNDGTACADEHDDRGCGNAERNNVAICGL